MRKILRPLGDFESRVREVEDVQETFDNDEGSTEKVKQPKAREERLDNCLVTRAHPPTKHLVSSVIDKSGPNPNQKWYTRQQNRQAADLPEPLIGLGAKRTVPNKKMNTAVEEAGDGESNQG